MPIVGDLIQARDLGMAHGDLALEVGLDGDAGLGQGAGMLRDDGQANLADLDQRVEHTAERDVCTDGAKGLRAHFGIKCDNEGRNVVQTDRQAAPAFTPCVRHDQPGGGIQTHCKVNIFSNKFK